MMVHAGTLAGGGGGVLSIALRRIPGQVQIGGGEELGIEGPAC